jgi:hypothetical protein
LYQESDRNHKARLRSKVRFLSFPALREQRQADDPRTYSHGRKARRRIPSMSA